MRAQNLKGQLTCPLKQAALRLPASSLARTALEREEENLPPDWQFTLEEGVLDLDEMRFKIREERLNFLPSFGGKDKMSKAQLNNAYQLAKSSGWDDTARNKLDK